MADTLSQACAALFISLAAVLATAEVVRDLRAGVTHMAGATAVRRESPVFYWLYVSMRGAVAIACICLFGYGAFQWLR
jgi:hypothetical protein